MAQTALTYRWSRGEFVRACEAGAFDHRVELVEGEVWPVVIGSWLDVWDPSDVLLVVEVADDTVIADLNIKAALYGKAGYPVYWVVTQEVIYEHTGPTDRGYRTRTEFRPGEQIPVGYAGTTLAVADLVS